MVFCLPEIETQCKPHLSERMSACLRPAIQRLEAECRRIGERHIGAYPIGSPQHRLIRQAHYAFTILAELEESRG